VTARPRRSALRGVQLGDQCARVSLSDRLYARPCQVIVEVAKAIGGALSRGLLGTARGQAPSQALGAPPCGQDLGDESTQSGIRQIAAARSDPVPDPVDETFFDLDRLLPFRRTRAQPVT